MTIAATPGRPKNPEITVVIALIGIWIFTELPNVFNRNKKRTPIMILIHACPINRTGLKEVPNNNRIKIMPTMIDMTTIGSN
mgnify:CR=1 FL=1